MFGNDGTPVDELDKLAKRKKHFNGIDKLRGIDNPINDMIEAEGAGTSAAQNDAKIVTFGGHVNIAPVKRKADLDVFLDDI